jgi:hypothetical protein
MPLDWQKKRKSLHGDYNIYKGYPLNVVGRTGITGRGILSL